MLRHAKAVVLLVCICLNGSCVNEIDSEIATGTIPILFSTKVNENNTRVTNTAFEKGDKVGLYAMLSSTSIAEKRYISNLKMECGSKGVFIPERTVFYPEGDVNLDFFSYYPYQPTAMQDGSSTIQVSVLPDQSNAENRSLSDFLVATKMDVPSSEDAVVLQHQHKFAKIKISILPAEGENVADIYEANPNIIITGFKTKATYDVVTDAFNDLDKETDIIPIGEWNIVDGALTGKEFIVIPQEVNSEMQTITMEWNGVMYNCPMPKLNLSGSTQCKISIEAMQTTSQTLTGMVGEIEDWGPEEYEEVENNGAIKAVHLAALSFKKSNIYTVFHKGEPIAEICKEYLNSPEIASRAIVIYPVKDEESDLSRGVLLKLLDDKRAISGGTLNWNTQRNEFVYTEGELQAVEIVYFDAAKNILIEKPDNSVSIDISCRIIRDIRSGNIYEYPIVKIGTQYWMKEDLSAVMYRDGSALTKRTNLGDGAGYYNLDKNGAYFYNGEALLNGNLAPVGWRIPSTADWESLKAYCGNDASLLKVGEWKALEVNGPVYAGTNLTDFSAYPVGMWGSGKNISQKQLAAYWTLNSTSPSMPDSTHCFTGSAKEFAIASVIVKDQEYYKAFSIRCIKD